MKEQDELLEYAKAHLSSPKVYSQLKEFICSYLKGISQQKPSQDEKAVQLLKTFTDLVIHQLKAPHRFELFHQSVRKPFDYYQFGLDLLRPVIDFSTSSIEGLDQVNLMQQQIDAGENVILLGNHQTEPDPQVISLLLEPTHPQFATNMIFVAGHRVTTDPLAIPFSMGCNLLCIYSKKHINYPPKDKPEKVLHNQKTLKRMEELLTAGGKCIYVAPSGGRDRANALGIVEVAPFDASNIELFRLIAQQSGKKTHFYPLAIDSYSLLPPPKHIDKEIGESREVRCAPIKIAFGPEIDMENFPGSEGLPKREKRQKRAEFAWIWVCDAYAKMKKNNKKT